MTLAADEGGGGATRNVLLTVQYDGTDFAGWQQQPGQRTVQGVLADAVHSMVHHPVTLYGSSRTDAGVHARGLPVNFETSRAIPLHGFVKGLNGVLPADVGVIAAEERPLGWRTRHASVAKTYRYRLQLGAARWPLVGRTSWHVRWPALDVGAMNAAAARLVGEHDFGAFRSSACVSRTTTRRLYRVMVWGPGEVPGRGAPGGEGDAPLVTIEVLGNAFLHNMVRIIAGTLVEVGRGRLDGDGVARALASGERSDAGPTAPAGGLTLWQVHFQGFPRLGKPASTQGIDGETI